VGRTPSLVVGQTFLHPEPGAPDLGFATLEPQPDITARVLAALPPPDVSLDTPCPAIKYLRRSLKDGDVYFLFNESAETQTRSLTLAGHGQVQVWDATKGTVAPLGSLSLAEGSITLPLTLGPQETRFIVIGPLPPGAGAPFPLIPSGPSLADLGGDWALTLGEKQLASPLKPWKELGVASFSGTARYRKDFTAPASLPVGKKFYLDLGDVHEIARVRVNGTDFEPQPWPPYVWDVTAAVKAGANTLEVDMELPVLSQQRFGGGGAGGANGLGRRGETLPAGDAKPRGFSPTGVPGGLGETDAPGGGRRGSAFAAGGPRLGGAPAGTPAPQGLLGPVRLVAQ